MLKELIKRAQNGDANAFTNLILSIKNDLFKIAKTRLVNDADIEDVIQETMIETYKFIKKLKEPEKFKKWVIKILINKCNKLYKKKYRNDISIELYNLDNYIMLNTNKDIEDDLNFYYLINTLKYEERIVIVLHYMEQYSIEDISNTLKMNKNTITTHLDRAREKIKKIIEEEEEGKYERCR